MDAYLIDRYGMDRGRSFDYLDGYETAYAHSQVFSESTIEKETPPASEAAPQHSKKSPAFSHFNQLPVELQLHIIGYAWHDVLEDRSNTLCIGDDRFGAHMTPNSPERFLSVSKLFRDEALRLTPCAREVRAYARDSDSFTSISVAGSRVLQDSLRYIRTRVPQFAHSRLQWPVRVVPLQVS